MLICLVFFKESFITSYYYHKVLTAQYHKKVDFSNICSIDQLSFHIQLKHFSSLQWVLPTLVLGWLESSQCRLIFKFYMLEFFCCAFQLIVN